MELKTSLPENRILRISKYTWGAYDKYICSLTTEISAHRDTFYSKVILKNITWTWFDGSLHELAHVLLAMVRVAVIIIILITWITVR